jgi:hypothetical protein
MTTALANLQGQLNPLKDVKPTDILARYLAEETSTQIAKSLGVTKAALSYYMLKHAETEWKDAQVVKALTRKEQAESYLESADNPLDLARGRELLKAAQWDLERVCRRIYGQDVQVEDLGRVSITLNIGVQSQQSSQGETLAGQVIDSTSELT